MAKKILLVDDDEAVRKLLGAHLTEKGFEVQTASDGLIALESLRKSVPAVVVLDVIMPNMDGYGMLREMKKDPKLRAVPVVVLTAREMMRDVFVQEGIQDFIVKPYDLEELYRVLAKYL
jgi:CheY-like chemotaxis protein